MENAKLLRTEFFILKRWIVMLQPRMHHQRKKQRLEMTFCEYSTLPLSTEKCS